MKLKIKFLCRTRSPYRYVSSPVLGLCSFCQPILGARLDMKAWARRSRNRTPGDFLKITCALLLLCLVNQVACFVLSLKSPQHSVFQQTLILPVPHQTHTEYRTLAGALCITGQAFPLKCQLLKISGSWHFVISIPTGRRGIYKFLERRDSNYFP